LTRKDLPRMIVASPSAIVVKGSTAFFE
jgi:hypothetical protein